MSNKITHFSQVASDRTDREGEEWILQKRKNERKEREREKKKSTKRMKKKKTTTTSSGMQKHCSQAQTT